VTRPQHVPKGLWEKKFVHNSGNRLGTLGPRCCPAGTNRPAKQLSVCPASEGINPRSKDSAPLPGLAPTTLAHTGGPLYDWGPWERTAAPARAKIQRQPSLPGSRHARIRPRGRADRLNQHSRASPAPPSCNMPLLSHNRTILWSPLAAPRWIVAAPGRSSTVTAITST